MFTGIITAIGTVAAIEKEGDWRFEIKTPWQCKDIVLGASIACSGVCLTVIQTSTDSFCVEVSHETLSKTTLGDWQQGSSVNLEPALKIGDELGGHIVSGHVDGLAKVIEIEKISDSHRIQFEVSDELKAFIAEKGSVCLDGISLTVNEVNDNRFNVNIIPHTWQNTSLGQIKQGQHVNLEIDMLARYMARMLGVRDKSGR